MRASGAWAVAAAHILSIHSDDERP